MTAKLDYQWNLRQIMATRGMYSTTDLRPLLVERGISLSPSQIYRLVVERPERLSLPVLMALLDILGCRMDELIEPISTTQSRPKKVIGHSKASEPPLGSLRPKRARVAPTGE
ncbi:helix-turn-helix domain-containing protein [Rhodococcus opacus]|uniref:helix-turn-helix domain-containing protein n=1 Tax=Rhodococcus opacus TaxID=37919 RepID=UPI0024731BF2|nr:helix-turn-helix transcriptional regulator [Rhodococcus opacus]MDH6293172.1 hypothetical protein [Rhodococcus opacus]